MGGKTFLTECNTYYGYRICLKNLCAKMLFMKILISIVIFRDGHLLSNFPNLYLRKPTQNFSQKLQFFYEKASSGMRIDLVFTNMSKKYYYFFFVQKVSLGM